MNEDIKKLIIFGAKNKISDNNLCEEIGISRQTFWNLRTDKPLNYHDNTTKKIKEFIKEKGL